MTRVLITGMSGTGKSSVILELSKRGFHAVDTDSDAWCEWVVTPGEDGATERDWVWREDDVRALLETPRLPLFVSGCKSNQGRFYKHFDHVVLLSAPLPVMLERIAARTNNPYGKLEAEREAIIANTREIEPLLRATCSLELDTSRQSVQQIADVLEQLAS